MKSNIEQFYLDQEEPLKSILLYLRSYLLKDPDMSESWKYGLPFFDYKKRFFCYFHKEKKTGIPYLAFTQGKHIDHPALVHGDRKQIAVLHFYPEEDFPIKTLDEILEIGKKVHIKSS
ncbi:MAG: DUF1801 domain-containing protein [Flavobacteriales bacterium]|nr:DUF1801 domain-containing protein [Flavobacteriales bacterium]